MISNINGWTVWREGKRDYRGEEINKWNEWVTKGWKLLWWTSRHFPLSHAFPSALYLLHFFPSSRDTSSFIYNQWCGLPLSPTARMDSTLDSQGQLRLFLYPYHPCRVRSVVTQHSRNLHLSCRSFLIPYPRRIFPCGTKYDGRGREWSRKDVRSEVTRVVLSLRSRSHSPFIRPNP